MKVIWNSNKEQRTHKELIRPNKEQLLPQYSKPRFIPIELNKASNGSNDLMISTLRAIYQATSA